LILANTYVFISFLNFTEIK